MRIATFLPSAPTFWLPLGRRGQPPADEDALLAAACALGDRFLGLQGARELEINPLFVHPRGSKRLVAVDALVKT